MKCEIVFQPGEVPSRVLLRDCKTLCNLREGSFEALVPGVQQGPGASHLVSAASVRVVEVVDYLELDHPGELVRESFSATIYLQ